MFEAASAKSDALRFAELTEKEANAAIRNVLESIDAGRKNKSTATNPQLIVAEEAANRALYHLEQAKAKIAAVEGEARVVEQYRDLVEEGRQQFHREMASIMPDVKLGESDSKLTEDELNMFITHAYRKVGKTCIVYMCGLTFVAPLCSENQKNMFNVYCIYSVNLSYVKKNPPKSEL